MEQKEKKCTVLDDGRDFQCSLVYCNKSHQIRSDRIELHGIGLHGIGFHWIGLHGIGFHWIGLHGIGDPVTLSADVTHLLRRSDRMLCQSYTSTNSSILLSLPFSFFLFPFSM